MIACFNGRFRLAFVLCAALGLVAGCSASGDDLPREEVSGTVTFDGQPLAGGSISFMPPDTAGAGGAITGGGAEIKDGKFSIPRASGLVPATYNVAIYASDGKAEHTKPAQAGGGTKGAERPKQIIPPKFNSETELKTEIKKGGGNDLKFTLDSK